MTSANPGSSSGPALHQMLGLTEDTSVDTLRSAYERAMNEAVRRGDNQRALALSKAFDNLPKRSAVYSSAGEPPIAPHGAQLYSPTERRARRVRTALRDPGPSSPGRPRSLVRRIVKATVVVLVIAAVVGLVVHYNVGPSPPSRQNQFPQQPQPRYTQPRVPDARTVQPTTTAPARRIPPNTPVDAQGRVRVSCAATRNGAAYVQRALPGSVVTCTNGAVPRIAG